LQQTASALHCLVLDDVYQYSEGAAVFHEVAAPTIEELHALFAKIITRIMRWLTKQDFLIEEQDRKQPCWCQTPNPVGVRHSY
jgi:hypothetical protein